MPQVTLKAERRQEFGSNAVKWLRRSGKLPAVLYGKDVPGKSISLTIDAHDFERIITLYPMSTLIELQLEETHIAIIKDIQRDMIKRTPIHVDFLLVNMDLKQEFKIGVVLQGVARGVKAGGILEQVAYAVNVSCLPQDAPQQVEVDVADLGLDAVVTAKDLKIPVNVDLLEDPLQVICTLKSPSEEKEVSDTVSEPELIRARKPE